MLQLHFQGEAGGIPPAPPTRPENNQITGITESSTPGEHVASRSARPGHYPGATSCWVRGPGAAADTLPGRTAQPKNGPSSSPFWFMPWKPSLKMKLHALSEPGANSVPDQKKMACTLSNTPGAAEVMPSTLNKCPISLPVQLKPPP